MEISGTKVTGFESQGDASLHCFPFERVTQAAGFPKCSPFVANQLGTFILPPF